MHVDPRPRHAGAAVRYTEENHQRKQDQPTAGLPSRQRGRVSACNILWRSAAWAKHGTVRVSSPPNLSEPKMSKKKTVKKTTGKKQKKKTGKKTSSALPTPTSPAGSVRVRMYRQGLG